MGKAEIQGQYTSAGRGECAVRRENKGGGKFDATKEDLPKMTTECTTTDEATGGDPSNTPLTTRNEGSITLDGETRLTSTGLPEVAKTSL